MWWSPRAQRAGRVLADFADVINAAGGTWRNAPGAVEFDERRQVVGEIDRRTVGKVAFQSELICRRINLAKVVDATAGIPSRPTSPRTYSIRNRNCHKQADDKDDYRPKND